ncbi:MAG: Crp/Fnr family transcriptional regulator [Lentisphaerae bacterium]|nr:Crp/Fnr family transcriptional regulator [Lentisphaerota bacterium]
MGKVPVFSSLSGQNLASVAALIRRREYPKGEILFAEGDRLDDLVIVNAGSVKAYTIAPDGREQILYVFSEGDFFGERNLFDGRTAPYTLQALEEVKTCAFSREDFRALIADHPDIALAVMEALQTRIARMENALRSIGVRSVDARVSALMLEFAEKYGKPVPEGVLIRLPLSREGMANYLGIARETVSRKLGQLEAEGVIRSISGKSLLILDREALRQSAGVLS